jgi:hypothetical protein
MATLAVALGLACGDELEAARQAAADWEARAKWVQVELDDSRQDVSKLQAELTAVEKERDELKTTVEAIRVANDATFAPLAADPAARLACMTDDQCVLSPLRDGACCTECETQAMSADFAERLHARIDLVCDPDKCAGRRGCTPVPAEHRPRCIKSQCQKVLIGDEPQYPY